MQQPFRYLQQRSSSSAPLPTRRGDVDAPRVSASYFLGERTVLKGGYGVYCDTLTAADYFAAKAGYSVTTTSTISDDLGRTFKWAVKVLFLGIGAAEGPGTKSFSEALMTAGVHNVYFESPGTAHEWLTWRRAFKEFAPRLFR